MTEASQCAASRLDGTPCRARALPGSRFCFFHDPERAVERDVARSAGGKSRCKPVAVLPLDAVDLPLATVGDVAAALAVTANQVRKGELDPKKGNCIGYLLTVLLKALEDKDLAAQLQAIKDQVTRQRQQAPGVLQFSS